ncbi:hypothetical protein JCM10212_005329, partial [Sporobolomyces blumeae]
MDRPPSPLKPTRGQTRPRPVSISFSSSSSSSFTQPPPPRPTASPTKRSFQRPAYANHRSTTSLSSLSHLKLDSSIPGAPTSSSSSPLLERSPSFAHSHWGAFTPPTSSDSTFGGPRDFEDVQNRTFAKWLNARLEPHASQQHAPFVPISDLGRDFSDGTRLVQLVECLTEQSLGRVNSSPVLRVQRMENTKLALDRIKEMGVHLTNIGPEDIVDGNRKLILGMIWSLVLRFSIADINEEGSNAKEGLLLWCQRRTQPYDEVDIKDFTKSWMDGLGFCALIHRHRPDLIDYSTLAKDQSRETAEANLAKAFKVAEDHLGIP